MTRITGGRAKGLHIETPRGRNTRPTLSRVREALFSMLDARDAIHGARVLDLFSGSGAMGLEAWSRGAERVVCVESDARAASCIRTNIANLDAARGVQVVRSRLPSALRRIDRRIWPVHTIVIDPPWADQKALMSTLGELANPDKIDVDAWIAVEHDARELPEFERIERRFTLDPVETRNWGDTAITLLRPVPRDTRSR